MRAAPDKWLGGDASSSRNSGLTERNNLEASIFITGVQDILHRSLMKVEGRSEAR